MNSEMIDKIVKAVLYEGYMLYPYRRSALKNRHRWNFGIVYPQGMDPCAMTTECLVEGSKADSDIQVQVRYLQVESSASEQEPIERSVQSALAICNNLGASKNFEFDGIRGSIEVSTTRVQESLFKVRVHISNRSTLEPGGDPLSRSLVSTHTILTVRGGIFVSLLDPPGVCTAAAASCRNVGTWPVLVGTPPARDCMLSSPIILYDYPQVAAESPGDFFDGTEIDELLTLRVLTLTDREKDEVRQSGERARRILERAESVTPEQLLKMHGTIRTPNGAFKPGDRVRLNPKPGGDVFDMALAGRVAIVESVEQDFEDRVHIAVVIEDDPGREFGFMRQPGHRFFFAPDEVERIA